jgi:anti-anti-sigma factor
MHGFSMSVTSLNGYAVLQLYGELDMLSAPDLSERIGSLSPDRKLVVDLTDLTFIDSHGIRALMNARHNELPLVVVCSDGNITRTLDVAQASRAMHIYKRLEDLPH